MSQLDRRRLSHRVIAVIGTAALALTGVVCFTTAASAVQGNMPTTGGELTIHKYEQPIGETPDADGNPLDPVPTGWVPMDHIPFLVQKITNVDLNTDAGWNLVNTYATNTGSIPAGSLQTIGTFTTDGGVVSTGDLANGAYLVTEQAVEDSGIVKMAVPFVITIPLPDAATKEWITDVHVYPKNSVATVTKDVTAPESYGLGDTVTWPIEVLIPALAPRREVLEVCHRR